MVERGVGRVLITSSVAATMPGPYYATYTASKAFLQSFAQAIRFELKDTGVTVTALQPGPTDADFFERAGMEDTKIAEASKDDPAEVARDGFEALMAGKDHVIAGSGKNKAQVAGAKPQRWRGKKLLTSVNDRSAAAVWRRGGSGAWRWRQLRRRQADQNSGKPCSSATSGPAPASTQCTPTSTTGGPCPLRLPRPSISSLLCAPAVTTTISRPPLPPYPYLPQLPIASHQEVFTSSYSS
jgi:hypothetical protein